MGTPIVASGFFYLPGPLYNKYPWITTSSGNAPQSPNRFTGGSILGAGTLQNNRLFDNTFGALNYPYLGLRSGRSDNAEQPVGDRNTGTTKAISTGTWDNSQYHNYIFIGLSGTIAGQSSTVMRSPGQDYQRIGQNTFWPYIKTRKIRNTGGWYYINGQPINAQFSVDYINFELNTNTYATPGRLTFQFGSNSANVSGYKPRTD